MEAALEATFMVQHIVDKDGGGGASCDSSF